MSLYTVVSHAKLVARLAHGNQLYSDRAYLYHLQMVEDILLHYGYDVFGPNLLAAGWLHDVIEDTNVTREEITTAFGTVIGDIVWACTGIGENRKERNASIYAKLREIPGARPVKLADRMANLNTAIIEGRTGYQKMYLEEHPEFRAALGEIDTLMLGDYEAMVLTGATLWWLPKHAEYEPIRGILPSLHINGPEVV